MYIMRKLLILSFISVFAIMFLSLGLSLTIKYAFIDSEYHYHQAICHINDCTVRYDSCCKSLKNICTACYRANINYSLVDLNEHMYTKSDYCDTNESHLCNQKNIACYYDDRSIWNSLRLTKYATLGGIVGISILSSAIAPFVFGLISLIIIGVCVIKKRIKLDKNDFKITDINQKRNSEYDLDILDLDINNEDNI